MENSTVASGQCCKIREEQISEVEKRTKISALLKNFPDNQCASSKVICSACLGYMELKPEPSGKSQTSSKKMCPSSSKDIPKDLQKIKWDTIIVNQVPLKFDREQFTSIFSEYGSVEDVYSCNYKSYSDWLRSKCERIVQVRFKHEKEARKVLEASRDKLIKLGDDILMITLVSNNYSPIENLPDDCLCEIFCRLPVEDKLHVEKVCKRWKKIGSQSWSHVNKIDDGFTSTSWKTIAPRTANSLQELILRLPEESPIDGENQEDSPYVTLALVAEHITNLKKLGISWCGNNLEIMNEDYANYIPNLNTIISKNQKLRGVYLQHINFNECSFDWLPEKLKELHVESNITLSPLNFPSVDLSRFMNLRVLAIFDFTIYKDQLKGIECLENLIVLKLDESSVHPSNIRKIVHFKKLEHLAISNCQISNSTLLKIVENNRDLKYLDISGIKRISNTTMRYVCQLPKLEDLWMRNLREVSYLGAMPQLRNLRADGCTSITDEQIQQLFTRGSKISNLTIPGCSITVDTFMNAAEFVRRRDISQILIIRVNRKAMKLWQRSGLERRIGVEQNHIHLFVSRYDEERDADDPILHDWLKFNELIHEIGFKNPTSNDGYFRFGTLRDSSFSEGEPQLPT